MHDKGKVAEDYASQWLSKQKHKILSRNFRSHWGEIDLIALDDQTVCFIEVRYRKSSHFGSAAESVTIHKQQRIIKTAQAYLQQHQLYNNRPARFDVLSMCGELDQPDIDWHKNAFMMSA